MARARVVRAFRYSPELANFRRDTYQGTTIASFCTDLNRKLAFAKEHEPALAAVGAGQDFQAKLEPSCAPSRPTVAPKKPPSPACPTTTAPSVKPKAASTSS